MRFTLAASAPSSSLGNVDVPGEVARGDLGQPRVDQPDGPDQRPGEDKPQEQREDDRPCCDADNEVPRARVSTGVLGDQRLGLGGCLIGKHCGKLVEVAGELLSPGTESWRALAGRRAGLEVDELAYDSREPLALRTDRAKLALVFGRRHESESDGRGRGTDQRDSVRDRLVYGGCFAPARPRRIRLVDPVEVARDVLSQQEANMRGVALELAVRRGPLLERPQPRDPVL
jgi:hypothetical protein